MSLFQIFHTAPLTLSALDRAAEDATGLQQNIGRLAKGMKEIATGIRNCPRSCTTLPLYFGPGIWDSNKFISWRESREISLRLLREARTSHERITTHLLGGEVSASLSRRVSDQFCEFELLMLESRRSIWSFGYSAELVEAAIGKPPTGEILEEARFLLRGAEVLTSPRTLATLEGIQAAIAIERENVSRSLFHAKLAVAGICTALVVGFSVCAYFLSQPAPSYKEYQKNS